MNDLGLFLRAAPVAAAVLAVTVCASLIAFSRHALLARLMLQPQAIVRGRRPLSLFTYGFVHADFMHLAFNMISFYSIAMPLENVLGSARFGVVYFGSMVLGALPTVFRQKDNPSYRALGASGAVAGLFFCGMLFFPSSRIFLFFLPVGIPYPLFAVLFLAASYIGAKRSRGSIGHEVHLYGALAGLLLTILVEPLSLSIFVEGLSRP